MDTTTAYRLNEGWKCKRHASLQERYDPTGRETLRKIGFFLWDKEDD